MLETHHCDHVAKISLSPLNFQLAQSLEGSLSEWLDNI